MLAVSGMPARATELPPACRSLHPARLTGFSIVELMTALAVAAVLMSVAVPSFLALIGRTRVGTAANDFVAAAKAARSEAMGRGVRVDMVPNDGKDWASGWTVFVDEDGNQSVGNGESVILRRDILPDDVRIGTGNGAGSGFRDARNNKTYLAFAASGYPKDNSGASAMDSLMLHNTYAKRKIVLSFLGRVRSCDPEGDRDC